MAARRGEPATAANPMQLLVLGGNGWLGRAVASAALQAGHQVCCLMSGQSGPLPAGARQVLADRRQPQAYAALSGQAWDAVIDVSSQPGQVQGAVQALATACKTYLYVSSASVYADHLLPGQDEAAPLLPALQQAEWQDMALYGQAKRACEEHVLAALGPSRCLIARAGLIGGPGDATDRSAYWPWRFARAARAGREVLVPDGPQAAVQIIDVRDLAQWLLHCAQTACSGVYNATGPTLRFDQVLAIASESAGFAGRQVQIDAQWLLDHAVAPWMGDCSLPLWIPMPSHAGFGSRSNRRALAQGLHCRPLLNTFEDVLAWEHSRQAPPQRRAGLSDAQEDALLQRWRQARPGTSA